MEVSTYQKILLIPWYGICVSLDQLAHLQLFFKGQYSTLTDNFCWTIKLSVKSN